MRWSEILRRALGGESTPPFRGGHSSPHTFDRFDSSHIGTGEGAQTFGHGLYFAENPEVYAEVYRRNLARPQLFTGEQNVYDLLPEMDSPNRRAAVAVYEDLLRGGYTEHGLHELRNRTRNIRDQFALDPELQDLTESFNTRLQYLDDWTARGLRREPGVATYETNLHLDPRRVLQQDVPLGQQSEEVREPIFEWLRRQQSNYGDPTYGGQLSGGTITQLLANGLEREGVRRQEIPIRLSAGLRERGIQGQIYPDGGSRGNNPDPTFNMVVHPGEESRIEILRRWGLLPFAGVSAYDALGGTE